MDTLKEVIRGGMQVGMNVTVHGCRFTVHGFSKDDPAIGVAKRRGHFTLFLP